jgi:hypothetical protein
MGMHQSALKAEQTWDHRHKHVNGIEGDGELTDITDYPKMSIQITEPAQVAKHGIRVGQIISEQFVVTA